MIQLSGRETGEWEDLRRMDARRVQHTFHVAFPEFEHVRPRKRRRVALSMDAVVGILRSGVGTKTQLPVQRPSWEWKDRTRRVNGRIRGG